MEDKLQSFEEFNNKPKRESKIDWLDISVIFIMNVFFLLLMTISLLDSLGIHILTEGSRQGFEKLAFIILLLCVIYLLFPKEKP